MRNLIIAVDVGRSAVKAVASYKGKQFVKTFPSIYSTSWGNHADPSSPFVTLRTDDSHDYFIDSNGVPHLFGLTAKTLGSNPSNFSESQVFHEFSVQAILYCILYFQQTLKTKESFDLGINLTYSNAYSKDYYAKELKKFHILKQDKNTFNFKIDSLFCFQQGYAALFNFLKRNDRSDQLISSGRGLVIDIGRYTMDVSLVDHYTLIKGKSVDLGTETLISSLQDALASKIQLEASDIELCFQQGDNAVFYDIYGHKVIPTKEPFYKKLVQRSTQEIVTFIKDFIGNNRVNYIYFVGGGSYIFGGTLSQIFAVERLSTKDIYANATGIVRFLQEVA